VRALEKAGDGIDQDTKRGLAHLVPALAQRQAALHPSITFVTFRAAEPLRHSTTKGKRSARLLVDLTPCSRRKSQSEAISCCKRLAKRLASSFCSWWRLIKRQNRAYQAVSRIDLAPLAHGRRGFSHVA